MSRAFGHCRKIESVREKTVWVHEMALHHSRGGIFDFNNIHVHDIIFFKHNAIVLLMNVFSRLEDSFNISTLPVAFN